MRGFQAVLAPERNYLPVAVERSFHSQNCPEEAQPPADVCLAGIGPADGRVGGLRRCCAASPASENSCGCAAIPAERDLQRTILCGDRSCSARLAPAFPYALLRRCCRGAGCG